MVDPALSGEERDAAARICDAVSSWPRDEHRYVPVERANWEWCTNSFTIPWLSQEVANLSFNHDIATVKDQITALLCKVLNARCQTRKYGTVAEKALFTSPDDIDEYQRVRNIDEKVRTPDEARSYAQYNSTMKRLVAVKQIVLCSLLGNYPHVAAADRHVMGETRNLLTQRFTDGDQWFQSLLHRAPMLVVWCMREYLVHAMLDQPGLLSVVHGFMQFDKFKELTAQAMSAARRYIQQNLPHEWSSMGAEKNRLVARVPGFTGHTATLCRCMHKRLNQKKGAPRAVKKPCLYAHLEWLGDMTILQQPYHDAMLLIAYRKPDAGTLSFLMGKEVRTVAPLVERELSPQEQAEQDTADDVARALSRDEEEEDQMRASLQTTMVKLPWYAKEEANRRFREIAGDERDARQATRKQAQADARSVAYVYSFITPVQFGALSRVIDLTGPRTELSDVVSLFCPHFGVPEEDIDVIDFILTLLNHYRDGTVSKHERMRQLCLLREREPHAYNLMQVAAELIKHHQRRRASVVGYLSRETVEAQVAALRVKTLVSLQSDDFARLSNFDRCIARSEAKVRKDPQTWSLLLQQLRDNRAIVQQRFTEIQNRFAAHPVIEETSAHLYACSVCNTVYSNVRDAHTSQRTYYRWGLRAAELCYMSGTLHCSNNKVSHMGHCATTPLHRVNLIGVRYALEKRAFQICTSCGDVFSPTASTGECDDMGGRGMMCCECSRVHRVRMQTGENDKAARWFDGLDRRCVCCEVPTASKRHTYLYPFDLVLCYRHHKPSMVRFVNNNKGRMYDREEAQAIIREFYVRSRANKLCSVARRGAPAMKRARQRARQRKA